MNIWHENDLVNGTFQHELTHVNQERRAGRTRCGRYVEFRPPSVFTADDDEIVNCLLCLVAPEFPTQDARRAQRDVDDRKDDVIANCCHRGAHNRDEYDEGDICKNCGY